MRGKGNESTDHGPDAREGFFQDVQEDSCGWGILERENGGRCLAERGKADSNRVRRELRILILFL